MTAWAVATFDSRSPCSARWAVQMEQQYTLPSNEATNGRPVAAASPYQCPEAQDFDGATEFVCRMMQVMESGTPMVSF